MDAEGWVAWKLLPSMLTEEDLLVLERRLPGQLPPLFRAFLTTCFMMGYQTPRVYFPSMPSDRPLGDFISNMEGWDWLWGSGYVCFAQGGNDEGPVCFDFADRRPDGDCGIVVFDHEHLHRLGGEGCRNRNLVKPFARTLASSFRELMTVEFLWAG